MIKIFVKYNDGTIDQYLGTSFKHGDKALVITGQSGYVAVPTSGIRAYEVQKSEAEEPDSSGFVDAEVQAEEGRVQEEADTEEEEAS